MLLIIRKCVIYKGFITVSTVEGFGVNGRFSKWFMWFLCQLFTEGLLQNPPSSSDLLLICPRP